ncbi:MAG: hypothetical protein K2K60_04220 [Clostridia bacterium]|nr:hypothetical protein [Clostridia bacterium]
MFKKLLLSIGVIGVVITPTISMGAKLNNDEDFYESRYCDAGTYIEKSEAINYDHKETTYLYNIASGVPAYTPASNLNNNCANVAGAVVVGYYDRFCENLMPNYTSYIKLGSKIIYKNQTATAVTSVMSSLYDLMDTNIGGVGTTFQGYQQGMSRYAQNCGYTYTSESTMNGSNIDIEKYRASVTAEKPVSIFLTAYSFYSKTVTANGTDTIYYNYSSVGHVVVGYGYYVETYYNSLNQIITTRTYLHVAGGQNGFQDCYLCLDGKSSIYSAVSATIQ